MWRIIRSVFRSVFALVLVGSLQAQLVPPVPGLGTLAMEDLSSWATIEKFIDDAGGFSTSVFNTAVASCQANNWSTLFFPNGNYHFATAPDPVDFGLHLRGNAPGTSILYQDYDGSTFLEFTGLSGGGGGAQDMTILKSVGTSGSAIRLSSTATHAPSHMLFRNVRMTITGAAPRHWSHNYFIDGSAFQAGPGISHIRIVNGRLFAADVAAIYAKSVVGLEVSGVATFPAGTPSNIGGHFVVTGTASKPSYYVKFSATTFGQLFLTHCEDVEYRGMIGGVFADPTASHVWLEGINRGSAPYNWGATKSYVSLR